jgi:hypothetical protein
MDLLWISSFNFLLFTSLSQTTISVTDLKKCYCFIHDRNLVVNVLFQWFKCRKFSAELVQTLTNGRIQDPLVCDAV